MEVLVCFPPGGFWVQRTMNFQFKNPTVCWPITDSGEIDISEHHGDYHKDHFTTDAIKSLGECDKYRLDGKEVPRNAGLGDKYPEPMFAILNYAKITDSPMKGEWVMEVDWVKHEFKK